MATWQCDFQLVLNSWLKATYGEIPVSLSVQILADEEWWQMGTLTFDYAEQLNRFAPRTTSWSSNLELYGVEDGNCVQILRDNGQIVSVSMRTDLRQIDHTFVEEVIAFSRSQECHWANGEGKLIAPELCDFQLALKESSAYRFVADPEKYLEELKINPIRFS